MSVRSVYVVVVRQIAGGGEFRWMTMPVVIKAAFFPTRCLG